MDQATAAWTAEVWRRGLQPDARLTVSEWADRHRVLSGKASSEPGPWRTARTPYLRSIMDELSPDSPFERVVVMAGAQLGKTEGGNNWLGYVMHYAPGPVMAVMPTVEGAKRWSRQRLDPMLEHRPLRGLVAEARSRDSGNTLLMKDFPGGTLIITGANSAVGLRSMPVRYLFMDELDGYPVDADREGDPVDLAVQRTATFGRRKKILLTSTPTVAGSSRIEAAYQESDQRRFWVPCPECGEYQVLRWPQVQWPAGEPEQAAYACEHCGVLLSNARKAEMLPRGEWRADAAGDGRTAGFHLSSLYSPPGWLSWGEIAREFAAAQSNPTRLQVFVNTKLAETWREQGDVPDWEQLRDGAGGYQRGTVPAGGAVLTAGVDIQADRIEASIWAWGPDLRSWLVDHRILWGDPYQGEVWRDLSQLLAEPFAHAAGGALAIGRMAVDSGFATQEVYGWARSQGPRRVMPVKGSDSQATPLAAAVAVDLTFRGSRQRRGVKMWPVGVTVLKRQLYAWLDPAGEGAPLDQVRFPAGMEAEYFQQLTAEQRVVRITRTGQKVEWVKIRTRNEALDCRIYATAAALSLGLDRWSDERWSQEADRPMELALAPARGDTARGSAQPTAPAGGEGAREVSVPLPPAPAPLRPQTVRSRWMERRG